MEKLFIKSAKKINTVTTRFSRFLLTKENFTPRLIAIKGARGTGKTTLLLQYANRFIVSNSEVLYVAMDDLFFQENNLYELADLFVKNNGKHLLLDEVHKYPNWSREIKLIYDDFPELQVVFTSSSILDIYRAESDLSRRAISYLLPELSLREYLIFKNDIHFPILNLEEIIKNHAEISLQICKQIKPIHEFNNYIKYGQYPYFMEDIEYYHDKLMTTINLILEIDLPAIEKIDFNNIVKLKQLLFVIATSVPFIPNISKLSEKIGLSRAFLIKALHLLEKAQLINQVRKTTKGISSLSKPDKIYLNNTNLSYALAEENPDIGNLRETFFVNQLKTTHQIGLPPKGDFLIDNKYLFEVGGKNKTDAQIKNQDNAFLVKDNIETGIFNHIPLWLFGFLY